MTNARTRRRVWTLGVVVGVAGLLCSLAASPPPIEAQGRLRAQVYLTQHQIPRRLNEAGLIRFARGHQARRLRETADGPIRERKWIAEMVTVFNRPVGDLEFQVLFYDIHDGSRRFIGPPLSTFINDRTQKTFVQRIQLPREQFKANRRMELVVVVRREEVGRQRFELTGEVEQRGGEVSFGDNET